MKTLSLRQVRELPAGGRYAYVEVPEFGTTFDEETGAETAPYRVRVVPLTVQANAALNHYIYETEIDDAGKTQLRLSSTHQRSTVMAALCAYDDEGNLVFGENYADAVSRVESLPARYSPAIVRIAAAALELAGAATVEDAQKN